MTSFLLLAALAGSTDAEAAKSGPNMWGVGPSIGTQVFPPSIPNSRSKFADWGDEVEGTAIGNTYADDKGKLNEEMYPGVQGDFQLGAKGVIYFTDDVRIGLRPNIGMGKNYSAWNVNIEADKILFGGSGMFVFAGGGLGMGRMKYSSATDDSYYNLGNYIARLHTGAYYKAKKQAYEVSLYTQIPFAYRQTLHVDSDTEFALNSGLNPVQYFAIGLEFTAYFGDFVAKNPKKKKNKKKGGKKRG